MTRWTPERFWNRGGPLLALMVAAAVAAYWFAFTASPAHKADGAKKRELVCAVDHRSTLKQCVMAGKAVDPFGHASEYAVQNGAFCATFGDGRTWIGQVCVPD